MFYLLRSVGFNKIIIRFIKIMKKIITLGLISGSPLLALAVGTTISNILDTLVNYLGYIVPALITIAVIYFIWGVIVFMTSSDEEAKKNGRTKIVNGLIGLFVIVAFWGIIGVVKNSFGIQNNPTDNIIPVTPF